jgi:hypothetical protein
MKALSVRQPFAHLIVHGYKDIENRPWQVKYRGRLLIHASRTVAAFDPKDLYDFGFDEEFIRSLYGPHIPIGALVGEADLVDCVFSSDSRWYKGPCGFVLENPIAYAEPIPLKGKLGLFEVDQLVLEEGGLE